MPHFNKLFTLAIIVPFQAKWKYDNIHKSAVSYIFLFKLDLPFLHFPNIEEKWTNNE